MHKHLGNHHYVSICFQFGFEGEEYVNATMSSKSSIGRPPMWRKEQDAYSNVFKSRKILANINDYLAWEGEKDKKRFLFKTSAEGRSKHGIKGLKKALAPSMLEWPSGISSLRQGNGEKARECETRVRDGFRAITKERRKLQQVTKDMKNAIDGPIGGLKLPIPKMKGIGGRRSSKDGKMSGFTYTPTTITNQGI